MQTDDDEGGDLTVHRSTDGGGSWQESSSGFAAGLGFAAFFGDPAGFALQAAEVYRDPFSSPELCYADLDLCGPRASVDDEAVLVSTDGATWSHLALDALSGLFRPSRVVHNESGDTVVLGMTDDGEWAAWVWAAEQGSVPTAEP